MELVLFLYSTRAWNINYLVNKMQMPHRKTKEMAECPGIERHILVLFLFPISWRAKELRHDILNHFFDGLNCG